MNVRYRVAKSRFCSGGAKYTNGILIVFAAMLIAQAVWLSFPRQDPSPRTFADFDAFYLAAQLVWRGEIEQAYHFPALTRAQEAFFGAPRFLPWTYPPQFNLLLVPLALLPLGLAYGLFTGATLIAYLVTLRQIAGEHFALVLLATLPAIVITILCGQNGFLTGTLISLTCLGLKEHRPAAGLPLGLMVIKPHLAVAFAVYTLAGGRWGTALLAAGTVAATSAFATVMLGQGIWEAFLGGMREAQAFLEQGTYPLFRMISPYAALHSFGLPIEAALGVQALAAILSLAMVCVAVRCAFPFRQALGLTAIASLLISPYAYDYDLPIMGVGLALLLPDLVRFGSTRERAVLYILSFLTGVIGLAQTFLRLKVPFGSEAIVGDNMAVSAAGLTLITFLGLTWKILRRASPTRTNG